MEQEDERQVYVGNFGKEGILDRTLFAACPYLK